jgi:hypothetical protein
MARQSTAGKTVSKAEAYRDAAAVLGDTANLDEVQEFIKKKYNISMEKIQISQYRNNEKVRNKKRRRRVAKENAAPQAVKSPKGDDLIEFVGTVRSWEHKLGSEKIREMIAALYPKK